MKVEDFLKSLQGVTADDLAPEELALLKGAIGDTEEPEPAPSPEGLLAKAMNIIESLTKGRKPEAKPEDEEEEDKGGKPKEDEDEEERKLAEAAELLAQQVEHEEEEEKEAKKSMDEITVEALAKSLYDQIKAGEAGTANAQTEVLSDLVKSLQTQQETIKAQGERVAKLEKSLDEIGSRPVGTQVAPFELRKAIDTQAGTMGLPAKDAAVAVMQKAFMYCTNHPDEVQMSKAISATDVQAVEGAYNSRDPEELGAVKPLIERAQSIVG